MCFFDLTPQVFEVVSHIDLLLKRNQSDPESKTELICAAT